MVCSSLKGLTCAYDHSCTPLPECCARQMKLFSDVMDVWSSSLVIWLCSILFSITSASQLLSVAILVRSAVQFLQLALFQIRFQWAGRPSGTPHRCRNNLPMGWTCEFFLFSELYLYQFLVISWVHQGLLIDFFSSVQVWSLNCLIATMLTRAVGA